MRKELSWIRNKTGVAVLLIFLSAIVYFNSLGNPFQFDDFHHIRDNLTIRNIKNIPSFFTDTRTFSANPGRGHYRPLLLVTHAINYAIGGLNPVGYHLVNLAFHAGSAFMVFLIVQTMLAGSKEGVAAGFSLRPKPSSPATSLARRLKPAATGSAACFAALAASLIFAVHPFNSEVVNYISARSSVMSGFFYLLAFYCWVKYRTPPPFPPPQGGRVREGVHFYIASLLAFLPGLLTKESVITLPIVIWLYDLYFVSGIHAGERSRLRFHIRRSSVYLPFLFLVALPYILFRTYLLGTIVSTPELPRSYYINFLVQAKVLLKYLQLLFFPVGLSVEHYIKEIYSPLNWGFILSAILLMSLLSAGIWLYYSPSRYQRMISFFIFWFFIVLIPTTIIPLNIILQENRGYLAAVTFSVILGTAMNQIASRSRTISVFVFLLILLCYSVATVQRNRVWRDGITLWSDAVRKSPLLARAHHNLAFSYREAGQTGTAIAEYQKAIELDPKNKDTHYNLGTIVSKLNQNELAIHEFKKVLEIDPGFYQASNNLGMTYWRMGNTDMAIEEFKRTLTINPEYVLPHINLGRIYEELGLIDKAYREFEMARGKALSIPGEEKYAKEAIQHMERVKARLK